MATATKKSDEAGTTEATEAVKEKRNIHRSPNFPFISLKKAVERARTLHDSDGKHPVPFEIAAKRWGYKPTSSGAAQTVSALRQFGLLAVEDGKGGARMVRPTDVAIRILIDQRPPERLKAVQTAALSPKIYATLWKEWGASLPSNATAESHLTVDLGYNRATAPVLLSAYRETLEFASLNGSSTVSPAVGVDEDDDADATGSEDDMPTSESIEAEAAPERRPTVAGAPRPAAVSPPQVGEEEILRAKLAGGRLVRVLFQGDPPTVAEIEKLIALLELHKDQFPST